MTCLSLIHCISELNIHFILPVFMSIFFSFFDHLSVNGRKVYIYSDKFLLLYIVQINFLYFMKMKFFCELWLHVEFIVLDIVIVKLQIFVFLYRLTLLRIQSKISFSCYINIIKSIQVVYFIYVEICIILRVRLDWPRSSDTRMWIWVSGSMCVRGVSKNRWM